MAVLFRYSALSALLANNPDRAHAILGPIELALLGESDVRIGQALTWHRAGAGKGLSAEAFLAQIPEIPASLIAHRDEFPLLTLVAGHIGNVEACRMAGLKHGECGYTDEMLVLFDQRRALPKRWVWIRAHDGTPNLGRKPSVCRAECIGSQFLFSGMDSVGTAIHLIHGKRDHVMDLPESVHASNRESCAYVDPFVGPELVAHRGGGASGGCGSVVFVLE